MKTRLLVMYKQAILKHPELEKFLLGRLRGEGNLIAQRVWEPLPTQRVYALYQEHEGRKNPAGHEYFQWLINQFMNQRSITWVLESDEGDEWVNHLRADVIGATDPSKAGRGTLREAVYRVNGDSIEKANSEERAVDNGVHCSDSAESGKRESRIFYKDYPLNPDAILNHDECKAGSSLAMELMRTGEGVFLDELIESSLRTKGIIPDASKFVSYEELAVADRDGQISYGLAPRGSETYNAAGSVRFRQGNQEAERRFVAKHCIKFCAELAVKQWMERRAILKAEGVMVPELFYQGNAEHYEQFLPLTAEQALCHAQEPHLTIMRGDIARIEKVFKDRFVYAGFDLKELRSDGERVYVCDFGEDIGAPKTDYSKS